MSGGSSGSGPSPRKMRRLEKEGNSSRRQALKDLHLTQHELGHLRRKTLEETFSVGAKYNRLMGPYLDKRATIIQRVPNFWFSVLMNHPQIAKIVDEEEEDALRFLDRLEVEEPKDLDSRFSIKFVFDENPFFENTELVKEFQLGGLGLNFDVEIMSTSTVIQWKEDMDLSKKQKDIIELRRKRGLNLTTFFAWFTDNTDPAHDGIARAIKDDLWMNPLMYYFWDNEDDDNLTDLDDLSPDEENSDGWNSDDYVYDDDSDEDGIIIEEEELCEDEDDGVEDSNSEEEEEEEEGYGD